VPVIVCLEEKGSRNMFESRDDELEVCERTTIEDCAPSQGTLQVEDWAKGSPEIWRATSEPPPTCASSICNLPESRRAKARLPKFHLRPTRRRLAVVAAGTLSVGLLSVLFWDKTYLADVVFGADLMRSGPLGEEALGEEQAPHTVIEYASLTCPHCAKFFEETFPALRASYIDTGKVRFILRELPFDKLGVAAAALARHAGQRRYFAFIEALLHQQERWTLPSNPVEPLFAISAEFGFTRAQFMAALTDQHVMDGIEWVRRRAAEKFNVAATPTFFIDGRMYTGRMSFEQIEQALT